MPVIKVNILKVTLGFSLFAATQHILSTHLQHVLTTCAASILAKGNVLSTGTNETAS